MTTDVLIPYRNQNKWGYYSLLHKKVVIDCKYLNASAFNYVSELDNELAIVEESRMFGTHQLFIDQKGNKAIQLKHKYGWINGFFEFGGKYFAKVSKSKLSGVKVGIIDKCGNHIFHCNFDDCRTLTYGDGYREMLLPVERNKRWGIVNQDEKIVAPLQFDFIGEFGEENLAVCSIGMREHLETVKSANLGYFSIPSYGFIDKNGNVINQNYLYINAREFSEGLAAVQKPITKKWDSNGKWGFIDAHFDEMTPFEYGNAKSFGNGLAAVREGKYLGTGNWGFINRLGELVIDYQFDDAFSFQLASFEPRCLLAAIKIGSKWGFIGDQGNLIIECKFDEVYSFDEGIAAVRVGKKWGFIDSSGKLVVPCKYDWVAEKQQKSNPFVFFAGDDKKFLINNFLIRISLNEKYGYIDTMGFEYWED